MEGNGCNGGNNDYNQKSINDNQRAQEIEMDVTKESTIGNRHRNNCDYSSAS